MKIDFSQKIKTLAGEELPSGPDTVDPKDKKKKIKAPALTLKLICCNALQGMFKDKDGKDIIIDGIEKLKRYRFADRIYGSKEPISLDSEEISLMKDLVSKSYSVLVSGQAWEMLESGEAEPKKPKETIPKDK